MFNSVLFMIESFIINIIMMISLDNYDFFVSYHMYLQEEMEILKEVRHAHVVAYHGLDVMMEADVITLNLIMEHVGGGSLRTKIQQFSPMNFEVWGSLKRYYQIST